jgi:transcriptional regulator with XRE-family HTH domain
MNPALQQRLLQLIETLGISRNEFGRKCDFSSGQISHMLSGKSDFSSSKLIRILEEFPQIRAEWLLRGEGAMFRDAQPAGSKAPPAPAPVSTAAVAPAATTATSPPARRIPVLHQTQYRAHLSSADLGRFPVSQLHLPELKPEARHLMLKIESDAMHPTLQMGDWAVCYRCQEQASPPLEGVYFVCINHFAPSLGRYVLNGGRAALAFKRDNPSYDDLNLAQSNVRELWLITHRFTRPAPDLRHLEQRIATLEEAQTGYDDRLRRLELRAEG